MEFFKIRKDIPFMRHAKVFNIISLLTFLLSVFLLATKGLHFSIEFTGGTVMEVSYDQPAEIDRVRATLEKAGGKDFDLVPLLALREGRRGHYPVDARLMARPAREDASGFLGVQVQVAMNNVKGTDYPYLYAVVLGKGAFRFPKGPGRQTVGGVDLVVEEGESEGVHVDPW